MMVQRTASQTKKPDAGSVRDFARVKGWAKHSACVHAGQVGPAGTRTRVLKAWSSDETEQAEL